MRAPPRLVAAAAILSLLSACTSVPPPPSAAPHATATRTLTLIDVPDPARLSVTVVGHPDAAAGQTRRMFYGTEMATAARDLRAALAPHGLRPGPMLTDALVKALSHTGHSISRSADFQAEREDLLEDYAKVSTGGRILDVVPLAIGYWTTYSKPPYRPWVVLQYRIYDAGSRATIASGTIGAGPSPNGAPLIAVPHDDRFTFESFDAVKADPQRATEGLQATIELVAAALAARI